MKDRIDYILEKAEGKTLHVGCGNSSLHIALLGTLKEQLYGLDFYDYKGVYPRFTQARAEEMPFGDESFDTIILGDVLMHVEDEKKVLQECYRVLKPKGLLIITTPNFKSLWYRLTKSYDAGWKRKLRRMKGVKDPQTREYVYQRRTTEKNVKDLILANGFEPVDVFITYISEDVNTIFRFTNARNYQRGWLQDLRYVMCKLVPEGLREQLCVVAKKSGNKGKQHE